MAFRFFDVIVAPVAVFCVIIPGWLAAQSEGPDTAAYRQFIFEQRELSRQLSDHIYGDYAAFYRQALPAFTRQLDSLKLPFDRLLGRYAPDLAPEIVTDDSLGTAYFFHRLLLEYPTLHFDFTGEQVHLDVPSRRRLIALDKDFDRPDYLANRDFRDYVATHLRLEKDSLVRTGAYASSNNQWLAAYWDAIESIFAGTQVRAFWKNKMLSAHLVDFGAKGVDTFIYDLMERYPNAEGVAQTAELFATQQAARADHRTEVYRTVDGFDLDLHLFLPDSSKTTEPVPAVVYFHGGSWTKGKPDYFFGEGRGYADRGWAGISVEYRIGGRHGTQPVHAVADAVAAIRWLRANADRLGIDPRRILATGNSAGGHLALMTAQQAESEGAKPDALMVVSGVYDLVDVPNTKWIARSAPAGTRVTDISPNHLTARSLPPTLLVHGSADRNCPYATAREFHTAATERGEQVKLYTVRGGEHFIWFGPYAGEVARVKSRFIDELGWQ